MSFEKTKGGLLFTNDKKGGRCIINNKEIRSLIKKSKIYHYEIANKLGISETTFVRKLRNELSEYDRQRILEAIISIRREQENDIDCS